MEIFYPTLISILICIFLNAIFKPYFFNKKPLVSYRLPPGPRTFPVIGKIQWLRKGVLETEQILRSLHARLGPMITLRIGPFPTVFVADRNLAHQALVKNGAVFADRPPVSAATKVFTSNQHNISWAAYGPTWRLLRRNITSEILHPSRVKSYGKARNWVLGILIDRLGVQNGEPVRVVDHLHYAVFCLLMLMCFGDKLEEKQIKQVESVNRRLISSVGRFKILSFWPKITKIVLRKRWEEFRQILKDQKSVLLPLIQARKKIVEEKGKSTKDENHYVLAYVDTLINLELPGVKRNLSEDEMLSLCSEFLNAGSQNTVTALQWILANLVKNPNIQEKLHQEIQGIVGDEEGLEEISDEDVKKMPYLRAVILEGLRRHPPTHFLLPHSVTEDTVLGDYLVPKNGMINFMVAEMGRDPNVWEDPMAFNPERFLTHGEDDVVDVTGSRGIKMMPFGAGRRICPGLGLAMHHLEYFVANLVWKFEWKCVEGDEVDLSEKHEVNVVMKNPLKAYIVPR